MMNAFCQQNFKREEQNFVVQNEINNLGFLTGESKAKMSKVRGYLLNQVHELKPLPFPLPVIVTCNCSFSQVGTRKGNTSVVVVNITPSRRRSL